MTSLTPQESGLCCRLHPATPSRNGAAAGAAAGSSSDGGGSVETLVYLPGMHGDWTLLGPFREALRGRLRLVEFTYPRRPEWTLEDHAAAVLEELARLGVASGWILGESFSSQTAWAIAQIADGERPIQEGAPTEAARTPTPAGRFSLRGLILAGGFVRHPLPWGVILAQRLSAAVPGWLLGRLCHGYGKWARRRCTAHGASADEIDVFVARRLNDQDRRVITSRYRLLRDRDLRPAARAVRLPVYCLTGGVDPIVPWPPVLRWLRRRCPGYRGSRVIWGAGHNVLLDAPRESADQISEWIGDGRWPMAK